MMVMGEEGRMSEIIAEKSQRPAIGDRDAWTAHWKAHGQPWRSEPEIDATRQQYLTEHRAIPPDIKQGIYPFKDVKLTRADVEWLLESHESGGVRGPVDWGDVAQRGREGLAVRGADLRQADLSSLPLARLRASLSASEHLGTNAEQLAVAGAHLAGAHLRGAHVEGATFLGAALQAATLTQAHLEQALLAQAHLEHAFLAQAHLEQTDLIQAHLEQAFLKQAHLERADLREAHLEGADLSQAHFEGANLRRAFFDVASRLDDLVLSDASHGSAFLAGVHWGGADLSRVGWAQVYRLGEEQVAWQRLMPDGKSKDGSTRLVDYTKAVRANRQVAVVLNAQGLSEEAARFGYRAQVLQRQVLRRSGWRAAGAYLFSLFLDLLAGYGYRPARSLVAYLVLVSGFAAGYFALAAGAGQHLAWYAALVISLTAFHGRGFFTQQFSPGAPPTILAAIEAVLGLLIEISFIATFTQRFLAR